MRAVLRNRDATGYLAGQALSMFGDSALWLAAGVWVRTLTGSASAAGLLVFVFAVPQLGAPLGGLVADRMRRRPLLIATNLGAGGLLLCLLAVHARADVWLIYLVMAGYGAAASVLNSAGSALLTVILPPDQLAAGNSALHSIREGLRLVAPLVGAGLYTWQGPATVVIIDAATFGAAALSLSLLRVTEPRTVPDRRPASALAPRGSSQRRTATAWARLGSDMAAGLRHIRATAPLRRLVTATALLFGVVGFSETLVYAITGDGLHRPPTFIGVLLSAQGAGAILAGAAAAPALRRRDETTIATVAIAAFAASALLAATPWLPLVLAGVAVFGASLTWLVIASTTLLQRSTPHHLQARVYATADLLTNTPQTVSIAAGAAALTVLDYRVLLLVTAAVALAGAGYLYAPRRAVAPVAVPAQGRASAASSASNRA